MPKTKRTHTILGALWLCALATGHTNTAHAEPPAPPHDAARADDATTYTFDDDTVLGDTVGAMGEVLTVRKRPERESLIRPREHFIRELLQSVEAL
jgi:hypothetical protein